MSDLLATKLLLPRRRPNSVERTRLIEQLTTGMDRSLTLIVAPAGFGKTTLMSQWIPRSERCVTWLALDEGDNDPARFWAYVIAALQLLNSDIGQKALVLLRSARPPPIEAVLISLLNEIAGFWDKFAIVLDDYHEWTAVRLYARRIGCSVSIDPGTARARESVHGPGRRSGRVVLLPCNRRI